MCAHRPLQSAPDPSPLLELGSPGTLHGPCPLPQLHLLLSPSPPADREEMIAAYVLCFCGSRSGAHHVRSLRRMQRT